jgi:hypothetical protein
MVRLLLHARQNKPLRLKRRGQGGKRIWGRMIVAIASADWSWLQGIGAWRAALPTEAIGALA